jgi:hypothetical protein
MATILDYARAANYTYNYSGVAGDDADPEAAPKRGPDGFQVGRWDIDRQSGFAGVYLISNTEVIVAYRGTNNWMSGDALNNANIARRRVPTAQVTRARAFFDAVKSVAQGKPISVTGHSLGGGLSQVVGAFEGVDAVTFNAPGMMTAIEHYSENKPEAIKGARAVNFREALDTVSAGTGRHYGVTHRVRYVNRLSAAAGVARSAATGGRVGGVWGAIGGALFGAAKVTFGESHSMDNFVSYFERAGTGGNGSPFSYRG